MRVKEKDLSLLQKARHRSNQLKVAYELLAKCGGHRILDLGCGNGILEEYFCDRECIGLDVDLSVLSNARNNAPWASYMKADIKSLPVKNESVDILSMIAVLGGVPSGSEAAVLTEARRVLRDGGHVVILVSQDSQPYSLLVPDRLFGGWRWRHFNARDLQEQLRTTGFEVNKILFQGGVLSLGVDLLNYFWNVLRHFFLQRVSGSMAVPPLPYGFLSRIESIEFHPFEGRLQGFARYLYIVARKS